MAVLPIRRRCLRAVTIAFAALTMLLALPFAARADEIDDFVRRQIRKRHIPGLALAIVQDGHVIKTAGYGYANLELHAKATPSTVFELASMSKQFAAAAILILMQDHKLEIDAPISRYLEGTPASWGPITVRRLLTHTSGLPREGLALTAKTGRADFTYDEMLKSASVMPLQYPPGERFAYSNLGFNLLALIVEKISGQTYGDFLARRIFGPLGMRSTRLNDLHAIILNRACGYVWAQNQIRIGEPTSPSLYFGAGAIVSTVLDLVKWNAALDSDKILTAESRKLMTTPVLLNSGRTAGYGFGLFIGSLRGHDRVSHDGLLSGFRSYIARFPKERLALIMLTNQSSLSDPSVVANGIVRRYIPDVTEYLSEPVGADAYGSGAADAPHLTAAEAAELTGRYEYQNNTMLTVEASRGRLLARLPGSEPDVYRPIAKDTFVCEEEATRLTFHRAPDGHVVDIELLEYDSRRAAPRIGPLARSLARSPDPDAARTARILTVLQAIAVGGKPVQDVPGLAAGARADFSDPEADLAGVRSIVYLGEREITDPKLTRHGGRVQRVVWYRWETGKKTRFIQIYLTKEDLVTDEDVVDS